MVDSSLCVDSMVILAHVAQTIQKAMMNVEGTKNSADKWSIKTVQVCWMIFIKSGRYSRN
jgi:hypothetical protein